MIEGITDRKVLPRLGKIRGGIKKRSSSGTEFPEETPYFVLNPVEEILDKQGAVIGTRENEHIKALIRLFGEKPHEMQIVFPSDDLDIVADANMKWWSGDVKKKKAVLMCRGNGHFANYRGVDNVSGLGVQGVLYPEGMNRICSREECPQAKSKACKPNMNLIFVVPEYSLYGVFQLDTTSSQAISAIWSCIDLARRALRQEGITSIVGVPMRMFRERKSSSYMDNGKMGQSVNYPVKIEVNMERLAIEKTKFMAHEKSTLALGSDNYVVDPLVKTLEEPDYDLLPKSEHGRLQTGEIVTTDRAYFEPFWSDPEITMQFKKLAEKTGVILTEGRMQATSDKFNTKEELAEYLAQKLGE